MDRLSYVVGNATIMGSEDKTATTKNLLELQSPITSYNIRKKTEELQLRNKIREEKNSPNYPFEIMANLFLLNRELKRKNGSIEAEKQEAERREKEEREKRRQAEVEVGEMSFIFSNTTIRSKGEVFVNKLRNHFGPIMDSSYPCRWTEANKNFTGFKIQDGQFLDRFYYYLDKTNILDQAMGSLEAKIGYPSTSSTSFKDMLKQTTQELRLNNYGSQSQEIHCASENMSIDDIKKSVNIVFANSAIKPPPYMIPFFEFADQIEKEI
jgi:hypothetical protein